MIESNDELITRKIAESIDFFLDSAKEPEKRKGSMPASIKKVVKSWHGKECPLCAVKMVHTPDKGAGKLKENEASWEHVLDLSLGGDNRLDNATVICDRCNAANNSTMINYIGQFGESFGTMRWKEAFVRDSRNLVRLHRFVEWKITSILQRNVDSYQELSRIWARYRHGHTIEPESPIYGSEEVGLFSRLLSMFRPNKNKSTEVNTEPSPAVRMSEPELVNVEPLESHVKTRLSWSDLNTGRVEDLGRIMVDLVGSERIAGGKLAQEINKFQVRNNLDKTGWKGLFKEFGIEITGKTTMNSLISEYFHHLIHSEIENTIWWYSSLKGKQTQKGREDGENSPAIDANPPVLVKVEPSVSSVKRRLSWSDLDTGSVEDLGRLLVDLIGSERIVNTKLGIEIGKFQKRNNLNGSGSKSLFEEFGIKVTNKKNMKSIISEKFPHLIRVEQVSRTECYYSLVNGSA